MPHVVDSKLFILWQHKASQRILIVVVVIVVLSPSRWGCKVCALPFWSGRMFYYLHIVPYILRCRAMLCDVNITLPISCDVAQCGAMWRNVVQCCAMWDSDEFLLGFVMTVRARKFLGNFTEISVE